MSPTGRVFIVLNLVLAGAFVGFAGTYLKNHTNWKQKHDAVDTEFRTSKKDLDAKVSSLESQLITATRENQRIDQSEKAAKAELADEKAVNQRLSGQVSSLEADIKAIKSDYATVASKVETAAEDAKKTLQLALAADEEKHKALNLQKDADAKLAEANATIKEFEAKVADLTGDIQKKDQTIGEQGTLIKSVQLKAPGLLLTAQPDVEGRVHNVSNNKLVTVEITNKAGELKPGNQMALYNGSTYKGEMLVTNVEGNFAFGKITLSKDGTTVNVGDSARTNVSH
jgi:chromosome segregation ATPase